MAERGSVILRLSERWDAGNPWGLSVRECHVLRAMLYVDSNIKIADALGLSTNTVCDYIKSAFLKMRVNCRAQAAVMFDRWDRLWVDAS